MMTVSRRVTTKITYNVMIEFSEGTMSGPSLLTDDEGRPLPPYDLGDLGPHPFSSGYPDVRYARDCLAKAQEYVRNIGDGSAWIEKVTVTTEHERLGR
jgi:hypothetical protein